MNHDTKTSFLVFLFIMAALTLSQRSHAGLSLLPVVPGYSASSGSYRAPAGSFSMAPANDGYIQPSRVSVGGKPITVPANLRMASNAGQFAKTAMRLNPWAIAGTLAAGYLIDQGLEWAEGEGWTKTTAPDMPGELYGTCPYKTGGSCWDQGAYVSGSGQEAQCAATGGGTNVFSSGGFWFAYCFSAAGWPSTSAPATPEDWDALPDPLPIVGPELPYAPYMPEGVPVDTPGYDFAPFATPVGEPYEKMDGSTAQPMAKVSPNGDSVTVDTYDQPLTDPSGAPVPTAPPVDTPEPQPDSPTQCDKYPNSLGCAELGTVDEVPVADETRSIAAIDPITTIGGVGACPAPLTASFMGQTVSFSYDMPCQFATSLKPLILAIAWLSAGLIFIGGVRQ